MPREGLGKVDRDFLRKVLLRNIGASNPAVVVGPGVGLDNAVISVGPGRVMVVTADPLSIVPSIGMEDSAWLSVHEIASDLATSGVRPQFAVLDYNLPPSISSEEFKRYAVAVSDECRRLGISIVGGHSGRYPGSDYTIVGGGMMMALADEAGYVTPQMVRTGDHVLMTKGAAIEATAVLALAFPQTTQERIGAKPARRAASYLRMCSTVEDSTAAASVGMRSEGVTAMHDATEGGVLGGLYELARTSRKTFRVERERIQVTEVSRLLCAAYGLDPLTTLSEGTLIITCRPERSGEVVGRLASEKIEACRIGTVEGKGPKLLIPDRGAWRSYVPPKLDPYWQVYAEGVRKGWK